MNKKTLLFFLLFILLIMQGGVMAFTMESKSFKHETTIPTKYTCDGANISPHLSWQDVPADTKSLALVVEDPDAPAGTWDHWILFNIPPTTKELAENIQNLPRGTEMGNNSYRVKTYRGPCPPDKEHRYVFKLYALDNVLTLQEGATKSEVTTAMNKHILGTAELIGRYNRIKK